jgi:zinc finger HIT domain-containing protein 3
VSQRKQGGKYSTDTMARLCQICETQESKYKCPSCRAPYCSAGCYKTHKETPCEGGATDATNGNGATTNGVGTVAIEPAAVRGGSKPTTREEADEHIDPTKLLTPEQLAGLRQSAATKEHLANPHVRELLAQVTTLLLIMLRNGRVH